MTEATDALADAKSRLFPETATVLVMPESRWVLCLLALCIGASALADDAAESDLESDLRVFLPKLQAAARRGPAAIVPLARFPLRVNGSAGKVLMLSAGEFTTRFADVFTVNVMARLASAKPDEVATAGGMVGNGALYITLVCADAAGCAHPVPRVTVVNTNIPPMSVPGVDNRETHCRYEHEGRSYPCSADNWLLRWLYDRPGLF